MRILKIFPIAVAVSSALLAADAQASGDIKNTSFNSAYIKTSYRQTYSLVRHGNVIDLTASQGRRGSSVLHCGLNKYMSTPEQTSCAYSINGDSYLFRFEVNRTVTDENSSGLKIVETSTGKYNLKLALDNSSCSALVEFHEKVSLTSVPAYPAWNKPPLDWNGSVPGICSTK